METAVDTGTSIDALALLGGTNTLVSLVITVLMLAGMWKIYEKAGQPGWAAIVPIYNIYVLTQIVGRPWWWLILLLIPVVNFVIALILTWDLAKAFGKGVGYFLGLLFFGFVFYPLLGFGDAQYQGASA